MTDKELLQFWDEAVALFRKWCADEWIFLTAPELDDRWRELTGLEQPWRTAYGD